jgi:hypothetical protein
MWWNWPNTGSEQIGDENGVAQLREPIRAPANRLVDVQPAGHN